jgi:hypothetical protein
VGNFDCKFANFPFPAMAEPTDSGTDSKKLVLVRGQAVAAFPLQPQSSTEPSASAASLASLASLAADYGSDSDTDMVELKSRLAAVGDQTMEELEHDLKQLNECIAASSDDKKAPAAGLGHTEPADDEDMPSSSSGEAQSDLFSALVSAAAAAPPVKEASPPKRAPCAPQLGESSAVLAEVPSSSKSQAAAAEATSESQPAAEPELEAGGVQFFRAKSTLFEHDGLGFTFSAFSYARCADWELDIKDKDCYVTCSGPGSSTVQGFVCACGVKGAISL